MGGGKESYRGVFLYTRGWGRVLEKYVVICLALRVGSKQESQEKFGGTGAGGSLKLDFCKKDQLYR